MRWHLKTHQSQALSKHEGLVRRGIKTSQEQGTSLAMWAGDDEGEPGKCSAVERRMLTPEQKGH